MELRLYVDEDAGEHAVIKGLPRRGVDLLTTIEADHGAQAIRTNLRGGQSDGRSTHSM